MMCIRAFGWGMVLSLSCLVGLAGTARVVRAPVIKGTIEGSIQHLSGEAIVLNAGAKITGDLQVPGSPSVWVDNLAAYAGTLEGSGVENLPNYTITLLAGSSLRHVIRRTDPVPIPSVSVPAAPAGNRFALINHPSQSIGDPATLHSLMLGSGAGQVALPPGTYGELIANANTSLVLGVSGSAGPAIYKLQRLTVNQAAQLLIVGPVEITVGKGSIIGGSVGSSGCPDWLTLKVFSGALTIGNGASFYGHVYSPADAVIIYGGGQLVGGLGCYQLQVDANATVQLLPLATPNQLPEVSLTSPALGANFTAPANFALQVSASDPDGAVAKVEFYQDGMKLGETANAPYTFPVTGLGAGTYSYIARAIDNLGAVAQSAAISLTVATPAEAPAVALTSPVPGTLFTLPAIVSLTADASAARGTIAKVEFFAGGTKLGEVGTPPYAITWEAVMPGDYVLTAKATDNSGLSTTSAGTEVRVLPSLPFIIDFETAEGFTLGSVNRQLGWRVAQGEAVIVESTVAASGTHHAVLLPGNPVAELEQEFGERPSQPTVAFIDFQSQPVAGTSAGEGPLFEIDAARISFARVGASGRYYLLSGDGVGNGSWHPVGPPIPLTPAGSAEGWQRLTVRLDYSAKTWDFYLGGALLASDLPFRLSGASFFSWFGLRGHATGATHLDSIYAGSDNPLFDDADRDGMDDAWEVANGLDPTRNDGSGDLDQDGLTNKQEWALGTAANSIDTDNDFIPDRLEVLYGYNPRVSNLSDLATDEDNDGLMLFQELNYGYNPKVADIDRASDWDQDGLSDYWEITHGRDPSVGEYPAYLNSDEDHDGLSLVKEAQAGTDPTKADSDGDGMPDGYEVRNQLNPLANDRDQDADGDGRTNLDEFLLGTDPNDYYNGQPPHITALPPHLLQADVLAVRVCDSVGNILVNAPVTFSVQDEPGVKISLVRGGPPVGDVLQVRTGRDGIARAYRVLVP